MGKQSTMTSGRSKKGQGGRATSKSTRSQSATPGPAAAQGEGPPRLKLKLRNQRSAQNSDTTLESNDIFEFKHRTSQYLEAPPPVTTRTGRTVHKPKHFDTLKGGDYEEAVEASSEGITNEDRSFEPRLSGDPSYSSKKAQKLPIDSSSTQPKRKHGVGRPPKNLPSAEPHLDTINEAEEASPSPDSADDQSSLGEDEDVYNVINILNTTKNAHLDLPSLSTAAGTGYSQPYTAKKLTQLYIFSYTSKQWDICDLVADTWIRAFHAMRAKSEKSPIYQIWRPNRALTRRKRKAQKAWRRGQDIPFEFDPDPKDYGLVVADPEMAFDVTSMNIHLLNTLYEGTDAKCGARLLWADALALSGDQTEKAIDSAAKRGLQIHHDLLFNIMQTGLRMVRRNLTLKIEESTEGAWCKRYHEHGKHEKICYREKAWRHNNGIADGVVDGGGVEGYGMDGDVEGEYLDARGNVVDLEELEVMDAVVRVDEAAQRGQKRGFDAADAEMEASKRVRFSEEKDAEGESEEG